MASYHIPVHSISDEDIFEDFFDETFPPVRYMPVFYDRPQSRSTSTQALRRESSRERDRLYRELVGHEPYRPIMRKQASLENQNGVFKISLDVKHYRPDEITMKVNGKSLIVSGKHHNETPNGFESSEFQRTYTIPESVDAHTLTSNITQSGVLRIEAVPSKQKEKSGVIVSSESDFQITLDVTGYEPDEISVRVNGRELIIQGETKDEHHHDHGKSTHHQQFTRHFTLPEDVDADGLSSRYSKDQIIVVAPRRASLSKMREVEIVHDKE